MDLVISQNFKEKIRSGNFSQMKEDSEQILLPGKLFQCNLLRCKLLPVNYTKVNYFRLIHLQVNFFQWTYNQVVIFICECDIV